MFAKKYLFMAALAAVVSLPELAHAFDYNSAINLAGRQRMLSQKLSKEILMIANGVNIRQTQQEAIKTQKLFGDSLDKLMENPPSHLSRGSLQQVAYKWRGFRPLSRAAIKREKVIPEVVNAVAIRNLPLLKSMNQSVQIYVRESAGGPNKYGEEVNLSGRQRMLTQKMSKEFYLVTYGYKVEANRANLKKTMTLFEKTLKGLESGDKSQGLSPAPTADIAAKLTEVENKWNVLKPHLQAAINGTASNTNKLAVANQNIPLLKTMNQAVQMYAKL